jgi:hypothetical protein
LQPPSRELLDTWQAASIQKENVVLLQLPDTIAEYGDFALRLGTDLVAIVVFAVVIYFRRHTRKDLAVVFCFFNIGLFTVVAVISTAESATAIGFGLFAMLSIIRLRSEPFSNRELGYFFGALVLGMVNGIGAPDYGFTLVLNVLILASIFALDHPRVMRAAQRRHVTLDSVHTNSAALRATLEQRLGAEVLESTVTAIDFVRDTMELEVQYIERPSSSAPHGADLQKVPA